MASKKPVVVSPLRVAPKKGHKKFRLVTNMRWVSRHLRIPKFKFEGLQNLGLVLERGDWMFTLDDVAGYHHWEIRERCRKFFGFEWKGVWYEWCVLPFGILCAPWMFTKGKRVLVKLWRERGYKLVPYMDDVLFAAKTREKAIRVRGEVLEDLLACGWSISWEKSQGACPVH